MRLYQQLILLIIAIFIVISCGKSKNELIVEKQRTLTAKARVIFDSVIVDFNINKYKTKLLSIDTIKERQKTSKRKILSFNKNADSTYFNGVMDLSYPDSLRAWSIEEITTIVVFEVKQEKVGSYTNGADAISSNPILYFIDVASKSIYFIKDFGTYQPPSEIRRRGMSDQYPGVGGMPIGYVHHAIQEYY